MRLHLSTTCGKEMRPEWIVSHGNGQSVDCDIGSSYGEIRVNSL